MLNLMYMCFAIACIAPLRPTYCLSWRTHNYHR